MPEAGAGRATEVLEEGDIFFLYRPRVEEEDPSKLGDIQRFFMVLRPRGGKHTRLIAVGRKRLPEVGRHERNWGFVALVTDNERKVERDLREETYETETRGERRQPAARPAGEGVYVISLEDGQMHLSYELELPESPGEVQDALRIRNKASYVLSVKNPERGAPPNVGLAERQKADYPDKLQDIFRGRRFAREDVRLLDYEGAEILLVGARTDPGRAYGIELEAEEEEPGSADTFRKLHMAKSRHPVKPLLTGQWD